MKKIFGILALTLITISLHAQKKSWKEMHDFHDVMGSTFHPAEEDDLQPLKENSALLVERAKAWQNSTVPEGYDGELTKPILKKLVKECEAIHKAVKAGKPDAQLKAMITEAHDTFHEIMEKCRKK